MTLEEVHKYYGTIEIAANAVNVTRQAFHMWKRNGAIPEKWQCLYEKVSGGKLKAAPNIKLNQSGR